ncbi:DUF3888 domain-containing protein [Lysinibacillus sphaericus]|uniref:DUF3888 domain-containing protein n=1 Tax=Lysinibacillus sphaericus TaxID=1421 RepID=UPI0021633790|nr:DUF3888 domain-containing protein [Lysinibacillus sphaericus]MCS1383573.1 DUF3888 domain-containing protein [Lysinibacillus sphaericus]
MKKIIIVSLLFMCFLAINSAFANSDIEYFPQNQPPSIIELAFLRELGLPILETMSSYGDNQLFEFERIEKIERNRQYDYYDVSLRVISFEGAHNPPYKLINITFRIPPGLPSEKYKVISNKAVISYKAKHITPEEVEKLSKFTN